MRRKRKGWRQSDLAARVGVRGCTVADWETGRTMPRASRLSRIARALDTTVSYLLGVA